MVRLEVLKKTWVLLQLHAFNPLTSIQDLSGKYYIDVGQDIADELVRLGADLDDPESIHEAITSKLNGG